MDAEVVVNIQGTAPAHEDDHVKDPAQIEQVVDADIAKFDAYFQTLGNDPLVRSEKAIIKTFLHYHLLGKDVPAKD